MQVTKCKHLPFDAGKTPYFVYYVGPILVDCFVAKNYIQIKQTQMLCYLC